MGKKEIITTALVTALLVTTQVVPVSAAECAVPNTMSANNTSASYHSPMGKYKHGCPRYFNFWKADFCVSSNCT